MNMLLLLLMSNAAYSSRVPLAFMQAPTEPRITTLVKEVAASGRVLSLAPALDDRIRIAPGIPPLLAFRYLEGRQRGRFGGLDLVLDDAGH